MNNKSAALVITTSLAAWSYGYVIGEVTEAGRAAKAVTHFLVYSSLKLELLKKSNVSSGASAINVGCLI